MKVSLQEGAASSPPVTKRKTRARTKPPEPPKVPKGRKVTAQGHTVYIEES